VRRPGHPTLEPERAKRVVDALRRLYQERFNENGTALAKALKRSQSAVSQLFAGRNAPSYETARRVAALIGLSVSELLGEGAPTSGHPRPNLVEALEYVRAKGRASEETIRDVRTAARHLPDVDVPVWLMLLVEVEARRSEAAQDERRERRPPPRPA
jgi:transcriptional regulator with XRE-family HTH domain